MGKHKLILLYYNYIISSSRVADLLYLSTKQLSCLMQDTDSLFRSQRIGAKHQLAAQGNHLEVLVVTSGTTAANT